MAAHLRELRSQSPRSSSLGLVPFSERIQLLARKLPVAAQVRHFLLCGCPLPRPGRDSAPLGRLRARAPCEGAPLIPPFRLGEGASGRASESGEGGRKSRITCSSCSAISGALTHLHLHRLESPVSPEAEAPGKGERVHWIKHVTRVGQVSGSHAPAAATTTLGCWQLVCYFFFFLSCYCWYFFFPLSFSFWCIQTFPDYVSTLVKGRNPARM